MILKQSLLNFFKIGAIPLLLTGVALRQIILVQTIGLSPWHGGGFGMFASIDRDERRVIKTRLIDCQHQQEIMLPELVAASPKFLKAETYIHVSTFPTLQQLSRVGQQLLSTDSQNPIAELYGETREQGCDTKIQLQVWRLVYDGKAIVYEPIADPVEVEL
ncbi:hypothetical protein Lepto7375DRAFT_5956 [Leptolyngbya sp. PCC 7375]|nr:hypothetical protein Lepto7375DRAFT_5956 [Leptolyngbya sp. PCC 7375]